MAKIDTSKIENYAEMTAEEKLAALEAYEFETPKDDQTEISKLKAALSKANSDAADWKRQFREKQTEQERAEAERAEKDKERDDLLKAFQEKERISSYTAKLMTAGVSAEAAAVMAKSLPDGVDDAYFDTYKSFMEQKTQEIEAAALGKQPHLSAGKPPKAETDEDKIVALAMKYAGLE